MERINLPTVEDWIKDAVSEAEAQSHFDKACQAVANALRWLFALSPPVGSNIGLIDGAYAQTQSATVRARSGRADHPFFGDSSAHLRYTGAPALERHINTALRNYRPRSAPPLAVEISNEPLVMVQGDIKPPNFLIDPQTLQVTIIDFGVISALPHSFVGFTLYSTRDCLSRALPSFWVGDGPITLGRWGRLHGYIGAYRASILDGFPVPKVTSRRLPLSEHSVKA